MKDLPIVHSVHVPRGTLYLIPKLEGFRYEHETEDEFLTRKAREMVEQGLIGVIVGIGNP